MALYKNYLLGYYYQIVTKSLSGCLAQRDVTMFLVRVKFIGSSNLCFDNFVVHRGIGREGGRERENTAVHVIVRVWRELELENFILQGL